MELDKVLKVAYVACFAVATLASATLAVCAVMDRRRPSIAAPEATKA